MREVLSTLTAILSVGDVFLGQWTVKVTNAPCLGRCGLVNFEKEEKSE